MGDHFLEIKVQEGFNTPADLYLTEEGGGEVVHLLCVCCDTSCQHTTRASRGFYALSSSMKLREEHDPCGRKECQGHLTSSFSP